MTGGPGAPPIVLIGERQSWSIGVGDTPPAARQGAGGFNVERSLMRKTFLAVLLVAAAAIGGLQAQSTDSKYLLPPKVIVDIMDAEPLPAVSVSPDRQVLALAQRHPMPTIADLAQPWLPLAGARINPKTDGPRVPSLVYAITFKKVSNGADTKVTIPANSHVQPIGFSDDSRRYAFTVTGDSGIALWIADVATGQAKAVTDGAINATMGSGCDWMDDSVTLLCRFVPAGRGPAPAAPTVPSGPNIQENIGKPAPVRTYEDMLTSAHDEALFEYYFTSQLAYVDAASGRRTDVGKPGIYDSSDASPNGQFVLVSRIKRPFSRLVPANQFPKDIEVWSRQGEKVRAIADVPLADTVPINGVITGPRRVSWNPAAPATLTWVEALDGGNLRNKVPFRDRVVTLAAPFGGEPTELTKTEFRFSNISYTEKGVMLIAESDRATRTTRTWVMDAAGATPRKLHELSSEDRYKDPGNPVSLAGGGGGRGGRGGGGGGKIKQVGDTIYMRGDGASPQGDRPFLDRLNLKTGASERLYRSNETAYETVEGLLSDDGSVLLIRREKPTEPPNYYVKTPNAPLRALTQFKDPAPQLAGIKKEMLTYDRKDGVKLSATLYLPPNYKQGERLPLIVWAYPREFTDPAMASQVTGSPNRFTTAGGSSHLLLLTQGYAILDNPTMPIVGPGETANDTYVEQLVASAEAAINKVVEMGVADRDRIGVGGHSYGGFMTANLLAHSRLFRAGFAESGAYNRTLTPFGFQSETRTFWEVPDLYAKMSPFWYANNVKDALLLMHGEADDNSGTFPIQSERFYMALKGHGATVRYVTLPHEAHGYAARETLLHVQAERVNWFDKYVKNAGPRTSTDQQRR
jgi:dipeptidyl aminopeptidase/acylaminoacyl peptidase